MAVALLAWPWIAIGQVTEVPDEVETPSTAAAWSATDTRLANHYIQLLQTDPEYGNVLDLLWGLYDKRSQTGLLLDYFKTASGTENAPPVARLIYAHLLRKDDQLDAARFAYSDVLDAESDNLVALQGAAELAEQQKRPAKALSLYNRLVELIPPSDETGITIRLRRAALLRETDRLDEAVADWKALLGAAPQNQKLRVEILALLLEAGRPEEASQVLEELASSEDPQQRLQALQEINRLAEFVDDFARAEDAARRGMKLLHFKHFQHEDFFARLVRLYERFGRLDELETELTAAASGDNPGEREVYLTAQFYSLTANEAKHLNWAKRLSDLAPENLDYRLRYILSLIENDQFPIAATELDALIEKNPEAGLPIVLLRTRLILNTEGMDAASEFLTQNLDAENPDASLDRSPETLANVLAFARENYLDSVVESLLSGDDAEIATGGDVAAPVELARFLANRGRRNEARKQLRDYVDGSGDSKTLRIARLAETAGVLRDLDFLGAAEANLDDAIALDPTNLSLRTTKAEIQVERDQLDGAIATYEAIWNESPDFDARAEMDQRLFSLLRGIVDDEDALKNSGSPAALTRPGGPIQNLRQYQKLARAANQASADGSAEAPSKRLSAFYQDILDEAKSDPTIEKKYRAAWWAFKLQDFREMYHLLTSLHDPVAPVIEVEKLLLDLAEQTENDLLATRQLALLAKADPDNEASYLRRWAELRFSLGYEEEAIGTLEELAADPEATLETLKTLAAVYARQGRNNGQIKVWEEAYRRANVFEKRQIIRQLTSALIEQGNPEAALEAQLDLIRAETDLVQKRKQFDSQLSVATRHYRLPWLEQQFTELAQQNPFDRFYPEALSRIYRASGNHEAAFQAMKRAYYMSGQDTELLAELGELASQTDDLGSAIYYRRQLIAQNEEEAGVEAWKPLIEMLESDLRVVEADRIRHRLEGKFSNDADFLRELSQRWAKMGRLPEAKRVLEKIVTLRNWDATAWFELGLLRDRVGDESGALEAFEKTLEHTGDVVMMPENAARVTRFPLIEGGWFDGSGSRPTSGGLEGLATAIEEYRFFPRDSTDQVLDYLGQTHPEFHRVPNADAELRLRAIEEVSRIHAQQGTTAEWISRWSEASIDERLWAAVYSEDSAATVSLLRDAFLPATSERERVFFNLLCLRVGAIEPLISWTQERDEPTFSTELSRKIYPPVAAFMLMQEHGDRLRDDVGEDAMPLTSDQLKVLFQEIPVSTTVGWHFTNELRRGGQLRAALALGEVLATKNPKLATEGDYLFSLSQISNWLGLPDDREKWLNTALTAMKPNLFRGLPSNYFPAITEKLSLIEEQSAREAFIQQQLDAIDQHPRAKSLTRIENRVMLAMADNDAETTLSALRELANAQLILNLPQNTGLEADDYADSQQWQRMERLLNSFAPRIPVGVPLPAFFTAIAGDPPVVPDMGENSESSRDQYEQFNVTRLIWLLEPLTPPERSAAVLRYSEEMRGSPTNQLELARTLETLGYHREAIPVYETIIHTNPDDLVPVRNLLNASRQARNHVAGLRLINGYLTGELVAPSGLTESDLAQSHAELLAMAGDIETLTGFARGEREFSMVPPTISGTPAAQQVFQLERGADFTDIYQRALIRAHRESKDVNAILRILEHQKTSTGSVSEEDAALAARLLIERGESGDREAALVWLESITLDQDNVPAEKRAISFLAEHFSSAEHRDVKRLAALGRASTSYDDTEFVREISAYLAEGGAKAAAHGLLQIRASESSVSIRNRTVLLAQMIRQDRESGSSVADVATDVTALLEVLPPDPVALREFFGLIGAEDASEAAAWRPVLEPFFDRADSDTPRLASQLALGMISDDFRTLEALDLTADSATDQERSTWAFGLRMLAETGHQADATRLGTAMLAAPEGDLRWTQLFSRDPAQQIAFFAAIGAEAQVAALHERLLHEAEADTFLQRGSNATLRLAGNQPYRVPRGSWTSGDDVPTFSAREQVPAAFAKAGLNELATSLFRTYRDQLRRITWEHTDFVEAYAAHLAEVGEFDRARQQWVTLYRKSLGTDPAHWIDFLKASNRLKDPAVFSAEMAALYPTPALKRALELHRSRALAE